MAHEGARSTLSACSLDCHSQLTTRPLQAPATAMFGFSSLLLKRPLNAFGVFMVKNKKNPELVACKTIKERGKKTAALFKKLSDADKAKLASEGKKLGK